ncbi:MAG: family 43 glycosylhydrolase [Prevotellaceae bacterium]|nr:family 43 glycosylhydrolase [Prevotellaceae bacterium]
MKICFLSLIFYFFTFNLSAGRERLDSVPLDSLKYSNPVIDENMPDPTVIQTPDGWFYVYATERSKNLPIYKSRNLVDWDFVGHAFTPSTRPDFEPKGNVWAPDVNYISGKYVMYYSMSVWGGEETCGIGIAVSDSPEGPFTDLGKLFRSNEIGVQNSIDPFYIEEHGRKYLFWGSFRGIYAIELSDDGLSIKRKAKKVHIGGRAFEGSCLYHRNGYWYFFASVGSCCEGLKSTYRLVVARSRSLFGTYTDKSGRSILDNGYETIINKSEFFVGNGHCSEIVKDKSGSDWVFYHAFRTDNPRGRRLMLDQLIWIDDWPSISGGIPSESAFRPDF